MSAEVITMEEFNRAKSGTSKMEDVSEEEMQENNDWARSHAFDLVQLAGNTFRVVLLVEHITQDILSICADLEETDLEELKAQLRSFVESGIENFETRCPHCSGE